MFKKVCPYCKERIKKDAVICRYCHKELDLGKEDTCSSSLWVFAGFVGLALGAAAALGLGYVSERKRWEEDQSGVSFDEEEEEESCQ